MWAQSPKADAISIDFGPRASDKRPESEPAHVADELPHSADFGSRDHGRLIIRIQRNQPDLIALCELHLAEDAAVAQENVRKVARLDFRSRREDHDLSGLEAVRASALHRVALNAQAEA